jgi:hypothetical protein
MPATWPGPAETAVLLTIGLVRTDDLPELAARWLADGTADTEAVRVLAGHVRDDHWALDQLMADVVEQLAVVVPVDPEDVSRIVLDHVAGEWAITGDTRRAVAVLSGLAQEDRGLMLGEDWVGLDDEWQGGWGRTVSQIRTVVQAELRRHLAEQA